MRSSGLLAFVFITFGALGAFDTIARAEESAPVALPEFLAAPPALPPGYDEHAAWRLDLSEALKIAMQQNLGITVNRKALRSADLAVESATAGMYEPTLSAGVTHTRADQPGTVSSGGLPSVGTTSSGNNWSLSLNQGLPTGAMLTLGLTAADGSSLVGEPGTRSTGVSFSLSQPILRGFSRDLVIPRYAILTAQIGSERERHQFEINAATLIQETETAYWGVVSTLYSYNVQVQAQKLAEDTVALVRRQIAAGMASASDLTGAENTFAQHKLTVLQGEAAVEQSWDTLRGFLNLPRDQWTRPILPTDRPHLAPTEPPSPEQALEAALQHRPEVALLGLDLKSSELALRKAENDALPKIDLGITGAVTGNGDSYGGALRDLTRHTTQDFSVTANLTWTPLGRASRANREITRIQHDVTVANREIRVQEIWNEVRAAVRRQRNAALQVTAALQSLTLANQALEIENRKYVAGSSSNLAIAQLQNGLANAEVAELSALLENESAQAALLLATGQLLEKRHIQLQAAPGSSRQLQAAPGSSRQLQQLQAAPGSSSRQAALIRTDGIVSPP